MGLAEDAYYELKEHEDAVYDFIEKEHELDKARDRIYDLEEQLKEARDLAIYWEHAYTETLKTYKAVKHTLKAAIGAIT